MSYIGCSQSKITEMAEGNPVATEVLTGNTADLSTFEPQVKKAADRFGCHGVTFVSDRGMIKSGQSEDLEKAGFRYITAITKTQIRSMIARSYTRWIRTAWQGPPDEAGF